MWCPHHFPLLVGTLRTTVTQLYLNSILGTTCITVFWHYYYFFITSAYLACQNKKIKVDFECCAFKAQWSVDYLVINLDVKTLCLLHNDAVAWLKEYDIHRHYQTKCSLQCSQFTGKQRLEKLESLK